MRRAVALLTLLLVVGTTTGAFAAVAEAAGCAEACGDGDEDCCPLVCSSCVCAARALALDVPHAAALPVAQAARTATVRADVVDPTPVEPGEIFHVPIAVG